MVIARTMDYDELLQSLQGRAVLWCCRTCARLCGIAGDEAVDRLEQRLRQDGVELSRSVSVSASCLADRVQAKTSEEGLEDADMVVALCCDVGAEVLASALPRTRILLPTATLGQGVRDADGLIVLRRSAVLELPEGGVAAEDACRSLGMFSGPFV